jgi:hypothetical protein
MRWIKAVRGRNTTHLTHKGTPKRVLHGRLHFMSIPHQLECRLGLAPSHALRSRQHTLGQVGVLDLQGVLGANVKHVITANITVNPFPSDHKRRRLVPYCQLAYAAQTTKSSGAGWYDIINTMVMVVPECERFIYPVSEWVPGGLPC